MKIATIAVALSLTAGYAALSTSAGADTQVPSCVVSEVNYDDSGPRVHVDCGGVDYWGLGTAGWPGCINTVSTDTVKMWEAMASTALLSGKKVTLYYNTQATTGSCGSPGAKTLTSFGFSN